MIIYEKVPGKKLAIGPDGYIIYPNKELTAILSDPSKKKVAINGLFEAIVLLHEAGFVYGDLKPQNLLVSRDVPPYIWLIDFETVRKAGSNAEGVMHTVPYSANRGETMTYASDNFALAIVLAEILQNNSGGFFPHLSNFLMALLSGEKPGVSFNSYNNVRAAAISYIIRGASVYGEAIKTQLWNLLIESRDRKDILGIYKERFQRLLDK